MLVISLLAGNLTFQYGPFSSKAQVYAMEYLVEIYTDRKGTLSVRKDAQMKKQVSTPLRILTKHVIRSRCLDARAKGSSKEDY